MKLTGRAAVLLGLALVFSLLPFLPGRLPGSERGTLQRGLESHATEGDAAAAAASTLHFRGFTAKQWSVRRQFGQRVLLLSGPGFTLAATQPSQDHHQLVLSSSGDTLQFDSIAQQFTVRVNGEEVPPGGKKRLNAGDVTFPAVQHRKDQAVAAVAGSVSLGVTRYWQGGGWTSDLEVAVVLERRLGPGEQLGGHLAFGFQPSGLQNTAIVTGI